MARPPFTAVLDEHTSTLTVAGDLDVDATTNVALRLETLVAAGGGTVDLTGLTFLPSSLVGTLIVVTRDAERSGATVRVVAAHGTVADRSLSLMGVPHDHE